MAKENMNEHDKLVQHIAGLSTAQLRKMLTEERDQYRADALMIAEQEIAKRKDQPEEPEVPEPSEPANEERRPWPWYAKALALGAGILAIDLGIGWFSSDLQQLGGDDFFWGMIYALYASLGILCATVLHKDQRPARPILLSLGTWLALRCILVGALLSTSFLSKTISALGGPGPALTYVVLKTAIEACLLYLPMVGGILLLRKTSARFATSEPLDIKTDLQDEKSKIGYDAGTCRNCGKITVTAKNRMLTFFGKSPRFFCQHCKSFIGGNPIVAGLRGIAESFVSFFFLTCLFALEAQAPSAPTSNVNARYFAMFALLLGVLDGLRKSLASFWAILKTRRSR